MSRASATLRASRFVGTSHRAPRRHFAPHVSATPRASRLGGVLRCLRGASGVALGGGSRLVPRRRLAPRASAAARVSRLGGASHMRPQQRLAPCASTAPCGSCLGDSRLGSASLPAPRQRKVIRMNAYAHARLYACALIRMRALHLGGASRLAPQRRVVPRVSRIGGDLRLGGAPCLAPWWLMLLRRFALRALAALRASPLGSASNPLATPFALHLDGALRLVPRRCLAICDLGVPRASPLGGASHLAPRRRFVPCVSAALARPTISRFRRFLVNSVYRPMGM